MIEVYKCPSCGGAVRFDANIQALACMWCGNTYNAEGLEPKRVSSELHGYLCSECGAQLMSDDFVAADTCPYCGNNEVAPHRFEGDFKPDYIIPFAIAKQRAIECYKQALAEKEFLPDDFIAESRILSLQGTYVPFWLQDGMLDFSCTYYTKHKGGIDFIYSTMHHHLTGTYEFSRVPADGSERMRDDMMDSVEPYGYDALVPFSTEYLPGFVAERYTIGSGGVDERIDRRVTASAVNEAGDTIDKTYDDIELDDDSVSSTVRHGLTQQALLPVWLIVVAYRGGKYLVGVNGQNGKVAVNLPIDQDKQTKAAAQAEAKVMFTKVIPLFFGVNIPELFMMVTIAFVLGPDVLAASLAGVFTGAPPEDGGTFALAVTFIVCLVLCLIIGPSTGYNAFSKAKAQILASMQNVRESTDASGYARLTITENDSDWGKKRKKQ